MNALASDAVASSNDLIKINQPNTPNCIDPVEGPREPENHSSQSQSMRFHRLYDESGRMLSAP